MVQHMSPVPGAGSHAEQQEGALQAEVRSHTGPPPSDTPRNRPGLPHQTPLEMGLASPIRHP